MVRRRPERLFPAAEHGQAGALHQPQGPARPRARAQAHRRSRRLRRELPSWRARPARSRLQGAREPQSRVGLLLRVRLRPYGARFAPRGLRPHRGGEERDHADGRFARRSASAASRRARRHVHRNTRRGFRLRRAARSHQVRQGAAHRSRPVRLPGVHARLRGPVLHDVRRDRSAGPDRSRPAALHAVRRVRRGRWLRGDRRAGRRRMEAFRQARGRRFVRVRHAISQRRGPQCAPGGDPAGRAVVGLATLGGRNASPRSMRSTFPVRRCSGSTRCSPIPRSSRGAW